MRLQRLGNRLLCPGCFKALREAPSRSGTGGPGPEGIREYLRRTVLLTFAGLAVKTLLFVPIFLWARHSDTGAAALRGAVAADVFTWVAFSLLEWPFRRLRVTAGAAFELVLVLLYWNRGELFNIVTDSMESTALSALFFFGVIFLKAGAWAGEHALEISGVREPASP